MDWAIVAGAAGAVLGSGLTLAGGWLTVRQRERAERRSVWLRRLEMALGELAEGKDPGRRRIGRTILESLATDEGVPASDRALADKLLARIRGPSADVGPGGNLDGPGQFGDNEDDAGGVR